MGYKLIRNRWSNSMLAYLFGTTYVLTLRPPRRVEHDVK
jgi:hypothetical protein